MATVPPPPYYLSRNPLPIGNPVPMVPTVPQLLTSARKNGLNHARYLQGFDPCASCHLIYINRPALSHLCQRQGTVFPSSSRRGGGLYGRPRQLHSAGPV